MQMNIYVPKDKEAILAALERTAKRAGRPKNELVLEALEQYLVQVERSVSLGSFSLGEMKPAAREELYRGRLEQ